MILIDYNQLDNYRYAVGKVNFLRVYSEYDLVRNYKESNCMEVIDKKTKEIIVISLFRKPIEKISEKAVFIFYQKRYFNKVRKSLKENENVKCLNDDFERVYNRDIVDALIAPLRLLKNVEDKYLELYNDLFIETPSSINNENLYKYWSKDKVKNNKYNVNDGVISFSNPTRFNDPFDCNCVFANNKDMSDLFRIFCVTKDQYNILMWSYYAEDHKGYCFRYKKQEIIERIISTGIDGLCIIGNVKYSDNRPKQRSIKNTFSFSDIMFYISAAFTKYKEWNHEKEYRFVIISDSYPESANPDYLNMNVSLNGAYEGCKGNGDPISNSSGGNIPYTILKKHPTEYRLI